MKLNVRFIVILIACGGLGILIPQKAHAQFERLYIKPDLGGTLTSDTELKEFFGEPLAPGSKVKFDPGFRFGFAAGWNFTEWMSLEGETGYQGGWIKSITDASRVDSLFEHVPIMANLRLECPRCKWVTPYIGGGVGGSFTIIDADNITIGGTSMSGADSSFVFAYQAFGGIRFRIDEKMGIGIEYHYFHADGAEWHAEFSTGTASDTMRFGGTDTHSLSVAFQLRF